MTIGIFQVDSRKLRSVRLARATLDSFSAQSGARGADGAMCVPHIKTTAATVNAFGWRNHGGPINAFHQQTVAPCLRVHKKRIDISVSLGVERRWIVVR